MESVEKKVGNTTITVDYRTELLGIIMNIGSYRQKFPHLFSDYDNKFYTDRIMDLFGKYKDHPVVTEFDRLVEEHSFSYDAPFNLFLDLDEHFKSSKLNKYVFEERLNGDETVYGFIGKLEKFSQEISFDKYYEQNKDEYLRYVNSVSKAYEKYDVCSFLSQYYGYNPNKKFFVNLTPFTTNGGYSCSYEDKEYTCFPVFKGMKKDSLYDSAGIEENVVDLSVHEFSHSYVNPITEKQDILNRSTNFFDDIRDTMSKMAYPSDTEIINEHIVRAVSARYLLLMYNDNDWYQGRVNREKDNGFIYIEPVIDSLIEYENNRKTYPRFDMFYPEIISNLKKYKDSKSIENNKISK